MFKLNKRQIDRISEIYGNLGLLFFAALVMPVFTGETINTVKIVAGITTSSACILVSVIILRGNRR